MNCRKKHNKYFVRSIGQTIAGLLWIAAIYFMSLQPVIDSLNELSLIQRGQITKGFVTDIWEDFLGEEDGWYSSVTYVYHPPNRKEPIRYTQQKWERLNSKFLDMKSPYIIDIEYLPDKPDISRIRGEGCQSITNWIIRIILRGAFLIVITCPAFLFLKNAMNNFRTYCREQKKQQFQPQIIKAVEDFQI